VAKRVVPTGTDTISRPLSANMFLAVSILFLLSLN
jgi:hypothetical protein